MTSRESGLPTRSNTLAWLLAILVLAAVLRLIRLGTVPYWHDEVHNLIASEDLYSTVVQGKLISNHPPLPYVLVAAWRALGLGHSEWTMRLLPALFGVATVGALFALVRRLFDARTALIAAFLLAIAPLHVNHSQDLKEYIYLPLVACLIGLFLHRSLETNRWRDWMGYGLLAGLGCYTEIFVGPLLIGLNLWAFVLLTKQPGRWKGWIVGNLLGALLFVPWLSIMIRKAVDTMIQAETWWIPPPSLTGVVFYVKAVAFGYTVPPIYKVSLALFALLMLAGFVIALKRNPRSGWFLLAWSIVPVAIVYTVSLWTESIFLIRAMLPYALGLYIALAVAVASIPARSARYVAVGVLSILSAVGLGYHYLRIYPPVDFPHRPGTHPPRDYDLTAEYILDRWQEGDVVVHSAASTWLPFFWYGFRGTPQYFGGVGQKFIRDIEVGNPRNTDDPALDNYWPQEPQNITRDAQRVWFVFAEWERKYLEGNATAVWTWLDSHFTEVDQVAFRGIDLVLYQRRADAPVVQRDNDDGVSANLRITGGSQPYRKVRLDNGLIPVPEHERRGVLTLEFQEDGQAHDELMTSTQFMVTNRAFEERTVAIAILASDYLLEAASLYEAGAQDEIWHVYYQHNPQPPPPNYAVPVASAHFLVPGTGVLVGDLACPPGPYRTLLFLMGAPGDRRHARSQLSLFLGETDIMAPIEAPEDETLQWTWFPGSGVHLSGVPTPIRVTATCLPEREPAYADLSYVALQRLNLASVPNAPVTMTRVLAPEEEWTHTAVFTQSASRVDVWVYEREPNGKAYHIFRIVASPGD